MTDHDHFAALAARIGSFTRDQLLDYKREIIAQAPPGAAAARPQVRRVEATPPDFPPGIPVVSTDFMNWSWSIFVPEILIASPSKYEQVVILANWARKQGFKMRATGAHHNFSPFVVPSGTAPSDKVLLVDVTGLQGPLAFTPVNDVPAVTTGVGRTVEGVTAFLQTLDNAGTGAAPGYSFLNMTAPGVLTIGGVLAIGAHGTGVPVAEDPPPEPRLYGSMSNLILSFTAVVTDPTGVDPDAYVLKTFSRSDPLASAFLVHLGRAFLVEVTLRVVPNYYLQIVNAYPAYTVLFEAPSATPSDLAISSLLDRYGRVEAIWFPFTLSPWVKTWQLMSDRVEPQVPGPYNYPWANEISDLDNILIRAAAAAAPGVTAVLLGAGGLLTAQSKAPPSLVMNGTARDLLLYVQDTTLRATMFGYAIQARRGDVQKIAHQFSQKYVDMFTTYALANKFPINGPVEMRFTTMDEVDDLGVAGAATADLAVTRSIAPDDPSLDTVVWIDALTIPGTKYADEFFTELESWFLSTWGDAAHNVVRAEWCKAWAYTADGAWTNQAILTSTIPAQYNQPTGDAAYDHAAKTLAAHDKHDILTNPLLTTLLPG